MVRTHTFKKLSALGLRTHIHVTYWVAVLSHAYDLVLIRLHDMI
ncbi:unnamed protein product [Brugia timori]|uniref:Uncharacterized protein n=1 Tax=Brugia timori TaxID=42155 RepID=A0A0R3R9H2_9BILA|nr:unnamed protein product [Brugia timori]